MKKIVFAVYIMIVCAFSATASAQGVKVEYQNLISVLSGYHGIPEADYWAGLDPDYTREGLMRIANDQKVFTLIRARALSALGYFKNQNVSDFIKEKTRTDPIPYMRSRAYQALAKTEGGKAVEVLGEGLKDEDVMVRLSCARSLRLIGSQRAKELIQESLKTETNRTAISVFKKSLENIR